MTTPPVPGHRKAVLYSRVDDVLRHLVRIRAAEENRTMSQVVEDAVRLYLRRPSGTVPPLNTNRRHRFGIGKDPLLERDAELDRELIVEETSPA